MSVRLKFARNNNFIFQHLFPHMASVWSSSDPDILGICVFYFSCLKLFMFCFEDGSTICVLLGKNFTL